jgi:hypothetical protein
MEILKIHASKLAKSGDIDYEAVVKLAEGFNGADLRNICTGVQPCGLERGARSDRQGREAMCVWYGWVRGSSGPSRVEGQGRKLTGGFSTADCTTAIRCTPTGGRGTILAQLGVQAQRLL